MSTLDFAARSRGFDRFAALAPPLAHWTSLCPDSLVTLGLSGLAEETVLERFGRVEIRQTKPGLSVQTRGKGERDQALATAMQRLRKFLCMNDRGGIELRLLRPLVMNEEAPNRWLVRMGLRSGHGGVMSPASRGGRIQIVPAPGETVAVLRLSGRGGADAVACGAEAIRQSLATTQWVASGAPAIRLLAPPSPLPFLCRFAVAVPVTPRAGAN